MAQLPAGRMRLIGFIGGMSWESSAEYYRLANELVRDRLGGFHSARCLLYSVDFAEVERLQQQARWDQAATALADAAGALERAGGELQVLCTNWMQKVADAVERATPLPLLHIADATAAAVRRAGLDRVGLLGTRFTMEQPFLRERLEQAGLEVVLPEAADRELVTACSTTSWCWESSARPPARATARSPDGWSTAAPRA